MSGDDHRKRGITRIASMMLLVASLIVGAAAGCDKETSTDDSAATSGHAFRVEEIILRAGAGAASGEKVPDEEAMKEKIRDGLYETPGFSEKGKRTVRGEVTYDVKEFEHVSGKTLHDAVMFGEFKETGSNDGVPRKFVAKVAAEDDPKAPREAGALIGEAVEKFVKNIGSQARIQGAGASELAKILEDDGEDDAAHLVALQELRERSDDVDPKVASSVRPFLERENDDLKMAASAALVALEDEASYSEIIEVAAGMSRDRNPNYVPMLYIIGDIGTNEAIAYLETVSDGHGAPTIRRVAKEALDRAKAARKSGAP